MDPRKGFLAIFIVPFSDVQRLEHVLPDFEELSERYGLLGTPATIPDTAREWLAQRYFTIICFPWTSNSIMDMP